MRVVLQSLPDWVDDLRGLTSYVDELRRVAWYAEELVEFARRPFNYIMEIVLTRFVSWFLTGWTYIINKIQSAFEPVLGIPGVLASPIITAGQLIYGGVDYAAGGDVSGGIAGLIMTINDVVVALSTVAGPAAPIVVLVFWGLIAIVAVDAARTLIRLLPEVIPWL